MIEFIEHYIDKLLIGKDHFTPEDDLYHDLDMNPPAISTFLKKWSVKFDVEMNEFDLARYYPSIEMRNSQWLWTALKTPFSRTARRSHRRIANHARRA